MVNSMLEIHLVISMQGNTGSKGESGPAGAVGFQVSHHIQVTLKMHSFKICSIYIMI